MVLNLFVLIVLAGALLKAPTVDFANFTYPAVEPCFPDGIVTGPTVLRHGEFRVTNPKTLLETETHLHSVVYGHLRSDGLQAAVILSCDAYGLPGMYNRGFLFDVAGRHAKLITTIEGGDEETGIEDIRIAHGMLYVNRCDPADCSNSLSNAYRLNGRHLQFVRQSRHKTESYPSY